MRYTAGALFLILGTPPPLSIMIGQPTRAPDLGQLHYKPALDQYQPRPEIPLTRERVKFRLWNNGPPLIDLQLYRRAWNSGSRLNSKGISVITKGQVGIDWASVTPRL